MDLNQNQYEYEEEIDLRKILFYCLYRWRIIFLCAIVLGAVIAIGSLGLGMYRYYYDEEYVASREDEYSRNMRQYEATKDLLRTQIANLEERIADRKDYVEKSVLMNINPYSVYRCSLTFYVNTGYTIVPELTYQTPDYVNSILTTYSSRIQGSTLKNALIEDLGLNLEFKYLQELVSTSIDYGAKTFTVRFTGSSADEAEKVVDFIQKDLETYRATVEEKIGTHTLNVMEKSSTVTIDNDILNRQNSMNDQIRGLQESLEEFNTQFDELKEPTVKNYDFLRVIKDAVKAAILAGIIGFVLAVGFFVIEYIIGGKLIDTNILVTRYQIPLIYDGKVKPSRSTKIDKWLYEQCTHESWDTIHKRVEMVTAAIRAFTKPGARIQVISSDITEQVSTFVAELSKELPDRTVIEEGNILEHPDAIEWLAKSDITLVIERKEKSYISEIEQEINLVNIAQKKVLGFVVLENY